MNLLACIDIEFINERAGYDMSRIINVVRAKEPPVPESEQISGYTMGYVASALMLATAAASVWGFVVKPVLGLVRRAT